MLFRIWHFRHNNVLHSKTTSWTLISSLIENVSHSAPFQPLSNWHFNHVVFQSVAISLKFIMKTGIKGMYVLFDGSRKSVIRV